MLNCFQVERRRHMGLFDTVILDKAKTCRSCGGTIDSVQTKAFYSSLTEYRIGDLVSCPSMFTGIIREEVFCSSCHAVSQEIYFTIWHTLLTGIYDSAEEAEQNLFHTERAELIDYINRHQKESETWHRRFMELYSDLESWYRYQHKEQTVDKPELNRFDEFQFFRIREFLEADDFLAALIEEHRPPGGED
jgi:hypothetical protein